MKYFWIAHTPDSESLMYINRRVAWVSPTFMHEGQMYWARISGTREEKLFSTKDQAKDWAQAVVLLTH